MEKLREWSNGQGFIMQIYPVAYVEIAGGLKTDSVTQTEERG